MMPNIANLRQENWSTIKLPEKVTALQNKVTALQNLEDYLAREEGRTACQVNVVPMKDFERGNYGRDALGNGTIEINRNLVKSDLPYQAVETLYHEDDHAHQYHVTQHPELAESEEQLRDWQMSEEGGYIQPEELNFSTYRFQPTETDANRTARERTNKLYQDTFQDQSQYPAYKAQKEQEIAGAQKYARSELGDNYEEQARQAVQAKYQAMMDMEQDVIHDQVAEAQTGSEEAEPLTEESEEELSGIYQQDLIPADKSHFTPETREAAEKVDRELAEEEAEMDAKIAEVYEEEGKKPVEDKPTQESAQHTDTPTATGGAEKEDEEQSKDYDYYSGYGM